MQPFMSMCSMHSMCVTKRYHSYTSIVKVLIQTMRTSNYSGFLVKGDMFLMMNICQFHDEQLIIQSQTLDYNLSMELT